MAFKDLVIPGESLSTTPSHSPGPGTHITNTQQIHASIFGQPTTVKTTDKSLKPILTVQRPTPHNRPDGAPLLPTIGTPIYGRVTRLTRTHAHISIQVLCPSAKDTPPTVAPSPFRGLLRTQDVRATEKDKIVLSQCFRVGDIVRAVVISLGDQGGYYLSTAGNEYGVVVAWSDIVDGYAGDGGKGGGNGCVPVGWDEVRDEVTGVREGRKVARVG
jgi:exosome complex component CSL4